MCSNKDPNKIKLKKTDKNRANLLLVGRLASGGTSGKEFTCQCRRCKRLGFDPVEYEMTTHSSKEYWQEAWKIPWIEETGGLQFIGSQRVRHN